MNKKFSHGDVVQIINHKISFNGISQEIPAFTATFMEEYDTYYVVYDCGYRYIPKEFVEESKTVLFDNNKAQIKCVDCDAVRFVSKAHLGRVKRCKKCQAVFNQEQTKERMQKKRDNK